MENANVTTLKKSYEALNEDVQRLTKGTATPEQLAEMRKRIGWVEQRAIRMFTEQGTGSLKGSSL